METFAYVTAGAVIGLTGFAALLWWGDRIPVVDEGLSRFREAL